MLRELLVDPDKLYSLPLTTEYGRTDRIMTEETLAMYPGQSVRESVE